MSDRWRFSNRWAVWATVAAAVVAIGGGSPSAQAQSTTRLTGTALGRQLAQPVAVHFGENPLRKALYDLGRAHRVAVLLDRRVDPGRKIDMQLTDVSLEDAFRAIARQRRLGVSVLGSVVYVGPTRVSTRLRTLAELRHEEIRRLPPDVGREFLLPRPFQWDDFAMPRALLEELARQHDWEIEGLDRIPHDLWAGVELPPLPPADQLTLILVQFDLTFRVGTDGQSLALIPVPADVALVRNYPGGTDPKATAGKLATIAPNAQVKVVGNRVYVKGLLEDHQRITSPRRPPRQPPRPPTASDRSLANKRFTLEANHPAQSLLEEFAKQLRLDLRIDEAGLQASGISLRKHVKFRVENATIDELLDAVARPLGLSIRRQGNVVEIRAKK